MSLSDSLIAAHLEAGTNRCEPNVIRIRSRSAL